MKTYHIVTPKAHVKQPKKAKPSPVTSAILGLYAAVVIFIMFAGVLGWVAIAIAALKYLFS